MSRRPAVGPARRVRAAIGVLSFGAIAGLLALFVPGRSIRVVAAPSSIAADCSRDVTVELTRWLQSVPPDTTVKLRAKGCYRTDTAVDIRGWRQVSLEGNGATLRRSVVTASAPRYPKANPTLRITDATDVAIRDLTIIGPDQDPDQPSLPPGCVAYTKEHAFDAAILLQGPHRVTIDRLFVATVYGDGVQIEPSTRQPEGVDIRDSTISSNGRQGVAMVTGSGLLIDHLTVGCSRRSGVDLEPDTAAQHIGDVTIENSTFTTWLLAVNRRRARDRRPRQGRR